MQSGRISRRWGTRGKNGADYSERTFFTLRVSRGTFRPEVLLLFRRRRGQREYHRTKFFELSLCIRVHDCNRFFQRIELAR
jgi:hypothetical protein